MDPTADLLRQARAGSPEALEALFARGGDRLLPYIRLRMGPRLRARLESQDLLQNTLLRACERLEQLRGEEPEAFWGWLYRIAENEIRDQAEHHQRQKRDARREVPLGMPLATQAHTLASQLALSEEAERLERALETLSEPHREVILLRRFEELGFAAISERLGRRPDACRMLYARAMAALTLALEPRP
jgi:RNA polymerase sigma-70 factor (ECF subfamily)